MNPTLQQVTKLRTENGTIAPSGINSPSAYSTVQIANQLLVSLIIANPDTTAHVAEVFYVDEGGLVAILASVPLDAPTAPTDEAAVDVLSLLPSTFVTGLVIPAGGSLAFRLCEAIVANDASFYAVFGFV